MNPCQRSQFRSVAEFAEPLPPGTEARLFGLLKPPSYEVNLYAEVPVDSNAMTLRLTIDDYPRAFTYRVPCSRGSLDLPEELDLLQMRILDMPDGKLFQAPRQADSDQL